MIELGAQLCCAPFHFPVLSDADFHFNVYWKGSQSPDLKTMLGSLSEKYLLTFVLDINPSAISVTQGHLEKLSGTRQIIMMRFGCLSNYFV